MRKPRILVHEGRQYEVPQNVTRVDGTKFKGWIVRFTSHPEDNRTFADGQDKEYNWWWLGWKDATRWAETHRQPLTRVSEDRGVRMIVKPARKSRNHKLRPLEIRIIVDRPNQSAKELYVGTLETATQQRYNQVMREAKSLRNTVVKQHRLKVTGK